MYALRITLRLAVLLLLGAAVISFAAMSSEYPGATPTGRVVALRDVLPLALLAWAHLGALDGSSGQLAFRRWAAVAAVGDSVLLAISVARIRSGGPPLGIALPAIAALLLACTVGLVWRSRHIYDHAA